MIIVSMITVLPSNDPYSEQANMDIKVKELQSGLFGTEMDRTLNSLYLYYKDKKEISVGENILSIYSLDTVSLEPRTEQTSEFTDEKISSLHDLDIYRKMPPENLGIYEFARNEDQLTLTSLWRKDKLPLKEMVFMSYIDFNRLLMSDTSSEYDDLLESLLGKILIIAGDKILTVKDNIRFMVYKVYKNEYGRK